MATSPRPICVQVEPNQLERQAVGDDLRHVGGLDERRIEELIAEARAGSTLALGQLVTACRRFLLNAANRRVGNLLKAKIGASDLVQEISLEAHRDFAKFRGERFDELLAWLRAILLHNIANAARRFQVAEKRKLARELPLDVHVATHGEIRGIAPSPRSLLARVEQQERVERAIGLLPADQRQVILLRNRDQLSFAEIGQALGRSMAAAHKLWVRAVVRLQSEFSDESNDRQRPR
jgi:RNA polymerase sigma-70 factor (subfamily 1)